ncbi:hypothetical protein L1887_48707 [Cichorium endivia]|nr:hypothetical protein L1887_48707 [Cichorium endivia]
MTELSLPCSYKKESLLRIESTHIEFSKDLNRCLPSNIVHPVDGLYYTKARSGLILAYSYEGRIRPISIEPATAAAVKGESHASVCGSRSHTLIPTGARSRPAALPKPIIISVPRPHCWKGSASKPYVELPPHTAPLGMEVGPAQACAVKKEMEFLDFMTRPRLRVLWTLRRPPPVEASTLKGISIAKDSIQPQVPLRLPCYDFTPVEDPTVRFQLHVPELQRTIRTEAIFPDSLRLTALLPISSALAAIKLKRTLEKKGLRLRKAPATFLLTAQLRAGTQLVALARHSAPRLTSAAKTFSLGACLSNTKRGFRSL